MISEYRFGQVETPVGYGSISFAIILLWMLSLFLYCIPPSLFDFLVALHQIVCIDCKEARHSHYQMMIGRERCPMPLELSKHDTQDKHVLTPRSFSWCPWKRNRAFSLKVTYRSNCDFHVDESEAVLSSRFIDMDENYFPPTVKSQRRQSIDVHGHLMF